MFLDELVYTLMFMTPNYIYLYMTDVSQIRYRNASNVGGTERMACCKRQKL